MDINKAIREQFPVLNQHVPLQIGAGDIARRTMIKAGFPEEDIDKWLGLHFKSPRYIANLCNHIGQYRFSITTGKPINTDEQLIQLKDCYFKGKNLIKSHHSLLTDEAKAVIETQFKAFQKINKKIKRAKLKKGRKMASAGFSKSAIMEQGGIVPHGYTREKINQTEPHTPTDSSMKAKVKALILKKQPVSEIIKETGCGESQIAAAYGNLKLSELNQEIIQLKQSKVL